MKQLFYFITLIGFLFFTSCHKDVVPELPDPDQSAKDSIAHVRAFKERCLLSALCDTEMNLDSSWLYTPTYGTVLYGSTPTVRYMVVDDLEHAKRLFFGMLVMALDSAETVNMTPNDITYSIEDKGSLHFSASSDVKIQIAHVEVNFPVVPELKEIVFIPKERWPYNDISWLRYGAVYKDKKTGHRFICIADTRSGPGYLITFDGKPVKAKINKVDYDLWISQTDWASTKPTYAEIFVSKNNVKMHKGMSDVNALYMLRKFMYDTNFDGSKVINEEAEKILIRGIANETALSPHLYGRDIKCLVSEGAESYSWAFGWWYYTMVPYFFINERDYLGYIKFWSDENWMDLTPSYTAKVGSSFNPEEHGLEMIYP